MPRIEVCGGIASGKTTLAKLIAGNPTACVRENFKANPFWKEFHANRSGYAFQTEISFLLLHYNHIKSVAQKTSFLACDFSIILDYAYADVTLTESQCFAFDSVYHEIIREIGLPHLIVQLRCGSAELQRRIRKRRRQVESSVTRDFLDDLNRAIERRLPLSAREVPIVEIDSERCNFAHDDKAKKDVIDLISQAIGGELLSHSLDDTE